MDDYGDADFLDDFGSSLGDLESAGGGLDDLASQSRSGDFNLAQPQKRDSWISSDDPKKNKK